MRVRLVMLFAALPLCLSVASAAEETPLLVQSPALSKTQMVFNYGEALKKSPVSLPDHPPYPNYHKK